MSQYDVVASSATEDEIEDVEEGLLSGKNM